MHSIYLDLRNISAIWVDSIIQSNISLVHDQGKDRLKVVMKARLVGHGTVRFYRKKLGQHFP